MIIKINIIELASELAHNKLKEEFNIRDESEEYKIQRMDNGSLVYTDEAQDLFNRFYEEFYSVIENLKER